MPVIAPSRRSIVLLHIGAQILFSFYLVHIAVFYYIRPDSISKLLPPQFSSTPQWAGNEDVSCPHKSSAMGQSDTAKITVGPVVHHYKVFNKPGPNGYLHVTYLDIQVGVPEGFEYKWVQVVAKNAPIEKDGVSSPGVDTFYDPYQHETVFDGSDYPFYYNTLYDDPSVSQPPTVKFFDQPQTEEPNMCWTAQTSLFAKDRWRKASSWIWLGTFEWGYRVTNHSRPDTLRFRTMDTGRWPNTQYMIDSLTKPNNFMHL
jgi:hypothetical protein